MGQGGYIGGSTVIHGGSGWFSKSDGKQAQRGPLTTADLAQSAEASARCAAKRQASLEARLADVKGAKRDAIKRLKRAKRKAKTGRKG